MQKQFFLFQCLLNIVAIVIDMLAAPFMLCQSTSKHVNRLSTCTWHFDEPVGSGNDTITNASAPLHLRLFQQYNVDIL
jgi:hypothetical protein